MRYYEHTIEDITDLDLVIDGDVVKVYLDGIEIDSYDIIESIKVLIEKQIKK